MRRMPWRLRFVIVIQWYIETIVLVEGGMNRKKSAAVTRRAVILLFILRPQNI